jgi:hypothetical protein
MKFDLANSILPVFELSNVWRNARLEVRMLELRPCGCAKAARLAAAFFGPLQAIPRRQRAFQLPSINAPGIVVELRKPAATDVAATTGFVELL